MWKGVWCEKKFNVLGWSAPYWLGRATVNRMMWYWLDIVQDWHVCGNISAQLTMLKVKSNREFAESCNLVSPNPYRDWAHRVQYLFLLLSIYKALLSWKYLNTSPSCQSALKSLFLPHPSRKHEEKKINKYSLKLFAMFKVHVEMKSDACYLSYHIYSFIQYRNG